MSFSQRTDASFNCILISMAGVNGIHFIFCFYSLPSKCFESSIDVPEIVKKNLFFSFFLNKTGWYCFYKSWLCALILHLFFFFFFTNVHINMEVHHKGWLQSVHSWICSFRFEDFFDRFSQCWRYTFKVWLWGEKSLATVSIID